MATITKGSPILITGTASSAEKVYDNDQPGGVVTIKFIHWYNPTTAGHLAKLEDKNGKLIWEEVCDTANTSLWGVIWTQYNSIYVSDLDSGELHIYV